MKTYEGYEGYLNFRGMSDSEMIAELKKHERVEIPSFLAGRCWYDVETVAGMAGMRVGRKYDHENWEEYYVFVKR